MKSYTENRNIGVCLVFYEVKNAIETTARSFHYRMLKNDCEPGVIYSHFQGTTLKCYVCMRADVCHCDRCP